jgi:lipopolysaccharide transport system ATP-binding protein
MPDPIIRVENLGKKYTLHHQEQERYTALRDVLSNGARSLLKPFQNSKSKIQDSSLEEFWALKDVSFEINRGDRVGIIGRNGAGKSTLLKILSRITEPTTGRISINGRVASLLEVGTGFHPELTGRENIFLNGAILGMSKEEIKRKFDEIVAFAEVEKFLDTPVKRYSSGMYVRLAFAVAAHLEPEILIVDEVLAVGDAQFQKKCLGKMEAVAEQEGRTVLFVSHNMAAVDKLCNQGISLSRGRVKCIGTQTEAITHYLISLSEKNTSLRDRVDREGSGEIRVTGMEFRDLEGNIIDTATSGQDIAIHLHFEGNSNNFNYPLNVGLVCKTLLDIPVFLQTSYLNQMLFQNLPRKGTFVCHLKHLPLPVSNYRFGYGLYVHLEGKCIDAIHDAAELIVAEGDFFGSGQLPPATHGLCLVEAEWQLSEAF